jgi:glycosyltransferase involved in cell wall biosynthesis
MSVKGLTNLSQVNKLRRIVIASVLKPVNEPRMYEKLGQSLSQNQSEVHIIGFPVLPKPKQENALILHAIAKRPFHRISQKRFWAPFAVLKKVIAIRPEILIITTHELLYVAILSRWMTGCKIIYDVQENYYRNIRYTRTFPFGIRQVLASWVRLKERICSTFVNHFILAEQGYEAELPFARPSTVLQNKLAKIMLSRYGKKDHTGYAKIIFTGTLAETTGVFNAIELVTGLHQIDHSFSLTIVGHCPSKADWLKLHQLAAHHSCITLLISRHPLPHTKILAEIQQADAGIIWYPENLSTQSSLPTKLFEYLGLGLPILICHNKASHHLVLDHAAGLVLKEPIDYPGLAQALKARHYKPVHHDWSWDAEFPALLSVLK